jgi:anti-sigma B factor antagonist
MEDRPAVHTRTAPPIVRLAAEIDVTNSDSAYADLAAACVPGVGTVIADMTQTSFCDSSGVRALVRVHKLAADDGAELSLVITSGAVLRILELSGLTGILRIYPSIDAAVTAWRDRGGAKRS